MSLHLTVPNNKLLQDISSFSPEGNYVILKIGSGLFYEKIKNEYKHPLFIYNWMKIKNLYIRCKFM